MSDISNIARLGDRVRHYGHQWPAAYRNGTATVLEVLPGALGTVEYLVGLDSGRTAYWSSETTVLINDTVQVSKVDLKMVLTVADEVVQWEREAWRARHRLFVALLNNDPEEQIMSDTQSERYADNYGWVEQTQTVDAIDRDVVRAIEANPGWRLLSVGLGSGGQTTFTYGWPWPGSELNDGDEGTHYYGDTCLGGHGELADIEAREADLNDGDER